MKPYTLTLSVEEVADLSAALNRGLFCAKECQKRGIIGAEGNMENIQKSLTILNRPLEGGYENEAELLAAGMAAMRADCERHGCD